MLPFVARISHPGYLAFIPGRAPGRARWATLIASALNIDTCWWLGASGPSALELVVLDWFRQWVGYPEQAAGVLVSGGSAANLTALACAREARIGPMDERAVVYMSDQTHSSLARAARALGFRPEQVRIIPTDSARRLRPDALRGAIAADEAGRPRPLIVVANAGTTATGAVDPFRELSEHLPRARTSGSTSTAPTARSRASASAGARRSRGMELADSITLDPHKWLYQPVELGALLVRDGSALRRGFEIIARLPHRRRGGRSRGELLRSRPAAHAHLPRAQALDLAALLRRRRLPGRDRPLPRPGAARAERRSRRSAELELMSPASLGVAHVPPPSERRRRRGRSSSASTRAWPSEIERQGDVFLSTARVRGRFVLRLCILNHSTTQAEVDRALELAATLPVDPVAAPAVPVRESYPPIEAGWLRRPSIDARGACARCRCSRRSTTSRRERVLLAAHEHHALPGEAIVEQWQVSRDLYVVLDGAVEVAADGNA